MKAIYKRIDMRFRRIEDHDVSWIKELFTKWWGGDFIVTRGNIHKVQELDGFIAEEDNKIKGLITFKVENKQMEVITLNSLDENKGIGSRLLERAKESARKKKLAKVWLITTNDNVDALRFYQKRDFKLARVHPGAIEFSRKLKPAIKETGNYGIPIRDEIELELQL